MNTEKIKDNKEIGLEVVSYNGYLLDYLSKRLRGEKDIVLMALRDTKDAIDYASEELKAKKEELFENINGIDEEYILKAAEFSAGKKSISNKRLLFASCAAILVIAVIIVSIVVNGKIKSPKDDYPFGVTKVLAADPTPVAEGMDAEEFQQSEEFMTWYTDSEQKTAQSKALQGGVDEYYTSIMLSQSRYADDKKDEADSLLSKARKIIPESKFVKKIASINLIGHDYFYYVTHRDNIDKKLQK